MNLLKSVFSNLQETFLSFVGAPNKLYFLMQHKVASTFCALSIAILVQAILFYAGNDPFDLGNSIEFVSIVTSFLIAGLLYFKSSVIHSIANQVMAKPYTAIIGLSPVTRQLIENELKQNRLNYLLIDNTDELTDHERFVQHGMGFLQGDIFSEAFIQKIDFQNMEKAVISLGNDRLNIEAATTLIKSYQSAEDGDTPLRIVVEIDNRALNELFYQNLINWNLENKQIEIQTFSFYDACTESLFEMFDIDAIDRDIIDSDKHYGMAVVGEGLLVQELVYQLAKLSHLPNQNQLTLNLVHPNAQAIKANLIKVFPGIEHVLSLNIFELDPDTPEFYSADLWHKINLTRVFVCDENEELNVQIATGLFNKTYFKQAVKQTLKTEVFFAVFNSHSLKEDMQSNVVNLKNFHTFGEMNQICTKDTIIDDGHNLISKLVHFAYGDEYRPEVLHTMDEATMNAINKKWFGTAQLSDKASSKAQAKHIKVKLKAMGLSVVQSDETKEVLLKQNRDMVDSVLLAEREELSIDDKALHEYSLELSKVWSGESYEIKYFPKAFTTLFEKLIRCEHQRWNAYHYLNGWTYSEVKDKSIREHDCLKPLAEFIEPQHKITVIYDIYSILYIPNYLTNAGFKLVKQQF